MDLDTLVLRMICEVSTALQGACFRENADWEAQIGELEVTND